MTSTRTTLLALLSVAACSLAVAQTPPAQTPTSPSSASSPHQRDSTSTQSTETPANTGTQPSSASTPHQQAATEGSSSMGKAKHDQMVKDCVTKERARDSSLSKDDAKKNCMNQMKMSSDQKTNPNK